jgi:hypothetical protein
VRLSNKKEQTKDCFFSPAMTSQQLKQELPEKLPSDTNNDTATILKNRSVTILDTSDVESSDKTIHGTYSHTEPLYLRWSRLQKTVTIKEHNTGLLRGSIAAPTPNSDAAFKKQGGVAQKIILDAVSGYAAPGEVLAMMG